jgi:hypothetical protein
LLKIVPQLGIIWTGITLNQDMPLNAGIADAVEYHARVFIHKAPLTPAGRLSTALINLVEQLQPIHMADLQQNSSDLPNLSPLSISTTEPIAFPLLLSLFSFLFPQSLCTHYSRWRDRRWEKGMQSQVVWWVD